MNNKICENCNKTFLGLTIINIEKGNFKSVCMDCRDHLTRFKKSRAGYIYIIGHGEFWKCGFTRRSPEQRLKEMQIGNPNELKILSSWIVQDCILGERFSQNRLKEFHLRGEWYMANEDKILNALK